MHNLVATGPFPPGQVPPDTDPEELVGLGFFALPAIGAGYSVAKESGILPSIGSLFSFGDTPDHDPEKLREWGADVAAGAAFCAQGEAVRTLAPGTHGEWDPGFTEGAPIRFDFSEVREAIRFAPRGEPGDDPGTVEGLRTAVTQPTPELAPYVRTDDALARVAVGVAHGRIDCGVGWQEEPAAVHLNALVTQYRQRPDEPAAGGGVLDFLRPRSVTGEPVAEAGLVPGGAMGGAGFLVPLLLLGVGAGLVAMGARR